MIIVVMNKAGQWQRRMSSVPEDDVDGDGDVEQILNFHFSECKVLGGVCQS